MSFCKANLSLKHDTDNVESMGLFMHVLAQLSALQNINAYDAFHELWRIHDVCEADADWKTSMRNQMS